MQTRISTERSGTPSDPPETPYELTSRNGHVRKPLPSRSDPAAKSRRGAANVSLGDKRVPGELHAVSRRAERNGNPRLGKNLDEIALFEGLDPRELTELERSAQVRRIYKGRLLYLPGDHSEAVFFLASGRVKISRLSQGGKELILRIVEPGDSFGEAGVVEERPRETMSEALEPSNAWVVPAGAFRAVLSRVPKLSMKLAQLMGKRQKQLEQRLMDVVYKNAPQRLADLLLELGNRYGIRDARGTLLRIKLSQSALGNLLGVSREIVNHTFSGLRRQGVIDVTEGRVIIRNPKALAELAA